MQLQNLCSLRLNVEEDLFKELGRLPGDLADTYAQIFEHVGRLAPQSRVIADRSLKWLLCQATELSEAEFLAAVSIGTDRESVNITRERILFICGNLVMFDHALKVFRFAHLSVREYLEAQPNFTLGIAHALGAEISLLICLHRYTELAAKYVRTFRPYAFVYWLYHCREAKKSGLGGPLHQLLEDFLHVQEGTNLYYAAWARSVNRIRRVRDELGVRFHEHLGRKWHDESNDGKEDLILDSILDDQDFPYGPNATKWQPGRELYSRLTNRSEDLILKSILGRDYLYDPTFAACFLDLHEIVEQNLRSVLSSPAVAIRRRRRQSLAMLFGLIYFATPAKKVGDLANDNIKAVGRRNMYGETYLHVACHRGTSKLLRLLLQDSILVHAVDDNHGTALHYAVHPHDSFPFQSPRWTETVYDAHDPANAAERVAMIGIFIEKGSVVDAVDHLGQTALHRASNANLCTEVQSLLEHGAFVDARTQQGQTPLHLAARSGHTAVAQLLLQSKADIEARDSNGNTPLLQAAWSGHTAVAQLLLQSKADIEARDSNRRTPLFLAAIFENTAVAQLLLQSKADIEARDSQKKTPLLQAAESGHTALAQLLLQSKADIEARDGCGRTPLFQTAMKRNMNTGRLLLRLGADINAKDSRGVTVLARSLLERHEAMAQMLIDEGASIKESDLSDNTMLHYAASARLGATISRLLEMGARTNKTNGYGSIPLHVAIEPQFAFPKGADGFDEAFHSVQLLVDAGADVKMSDDGGRTPLHLAAKMADEDSVQILLNRGADVKAEDSKGLLPLDHAALSGSLQVFSILFKRWADVMAESSESAVEAWLHQAAKPVEKVQLEEEIGDFEVLRRWKNMNIEDLIEMTTSGSNFQKIWAERGPPGLRTWYRARLIVREMRARREPRPIV